MASEHAHKIDGAVRKLRAVMEAFDMKGTNRATMLNAINTIETLRTRPAPAATDTGLVTVAFRHPTAGWASQHYRDVAPHCQRSGPKPEHLVTRSQAEELLAAERVENDEAYELGKRDGYSEAVQEIDLKTGGDGEYRYCTDHDPERHTPDPASMIQRIVERFETLNTMESVSEINEWKERAEKAEADNAAKDARVKELETERTMIVSHATMGETDGIGLTVNEISVCVTALRNKLYDEGKKQAEALEAKIAAAVEAHKSLFGDKTMEGILWPDVKPTDLITIRVQKQIYDKARAVLGGKPS
ncbi:hypothetical protein R5W60_16590 [Brucella pseudintermedia]|uniref:hypothetical protein n=1 Tax=Brucella pseudintermedia TaxID=370111 RepID=UPI00366BF347|nr:hypothetical protein R5W60_16590 [Brucella pseudintermedia]